MITKLEGGSPIATVTNQLALDRQKHSKHSEKNNSNKSWPQWLAVISASLSFFSRGLHAAWTSPALPKYLADNETIDRYFSITNNEGSWIVVSYSASICIGAPLAAFLIGAVGRKNSILISAVPHLIGFLLIAFARSVEYIYVARILAGISEGISNIAVPIYVGEIAHENLRGTLGSTTSVVIVIGQLVTNIVGSYMSIFKSALFCSIFPILMLVIFLWMPESPYYYLMNKKTEKAKNALQRLRGIDEVDEELSKIRMALDKQIKEKGSLIDLIRVKSNRRSLFIGLGIECIQTGTGIVAIQSYTQVIFMASGTNISAQLSSILFQSVQLISSIIAINFVDRLGRKPLLIFSCIGCGFALILEGLYFYLKMMEFEYLSWLHWLPITALILYIALYSSGLAILINVLLGELFSANFKGRAIGVTVIFYGLWAFTLSRLFYLMVESVGLFFPFWMFAVIAFLGSVFVLFAVPETKGKTLGDIQEYFQR